MNYYYRLDIELSFRNKKNNEIKVKVSTGKIKVTKELESLHKEINKAILERIDRKINNALIKNNFPTAYLGWDNITTQGIKVLDIKEIYYILILRV